MWNTILFDLDGTLTDSAAGIASSVQYTLRQFGIDEPDVDKLRCFVGPPLYQYFMEYAHFSPEDAEKAVTIYREHYNREGMYINEVYPMIPEMLRCLRMNGKKLAVVTSKETSQAEAILTKFGLRSYFAAVVGCQPDNSDAAKDQLILKALRVLGKEYARNDVIMVGDRFYDIDGAKEVGIASCGVSYGYGSKEELTDSGAGYVAENVGQLGRYLNGTGRGPMNDTRTGFLHNTWRILYPILIWFAVTNLVAGIGGAIYGVMQISSTLAGMDLTNMDYYEIYSLVMNKMLYEGDLYSVTMVLQGVADVILIPILYGIYKKDETYRIGAKVKLKNDKKPAVSEAVRALAMGFSVSVVINLLVSITGISQWMYDTNPERYDMLSSLPVYGEFIILCILAPVVEELLFRGIVFRRLRDHHGYMYAAFFSAALFGIVHWDLVTGISAFLIGILMAMLYEYTGSVFTSMFFHFGFNFFSIFLELIHVDEMSDETASVVLLALLAVCAFAAVFTFVSFLRKNKNKGLEE